jgi:hypothetical protein
VRTRRVPLALAVSLFVAACALATPRAESATKLFITNHVNSNQVAGLAVWQGRMAAGTLGGIVLADPATGAIQKILRSPAGLPSNSILCVAVSPSGALWAGTADKGVARLKADGGYRRTLTSFDGLPTDRVQTIYVHGDSIWVGTSGGVALFTENPSSGQVVLRRSDSRASTAGGLPAGSRSSRAAPGPAVRRCWPSRSAHWSSIRIRSGRGHRSGRGGTPTGSSPRSPRATPGRASPSTRTAARSTPARRAQGDSVMRGPRGPRSRARESSTPT